MKKTVVYPGTFDPITNGHIDLINRASVIFSDIIIAVSDHSKKRCYFNITDRIKFIKSAIKNINNNSNIKIISFNNLLIDFLEQQQANIIIRGLRSSSDFDYELQLAMINNKLSKKIETIFFAPSEQSMFISSTLVREIAILGGDVSELTTIEVCSAFKSD